MKKLLRILGIIIITGSGMSGVVANSPYIITVPKNNVLSSNLKFEILPPTSVENIIQTFMNGTQEAFEQNFSYWVDTAKDKVSEYYNNFLINRTGSLYTKNMTAISDNVVQTFENNYINNTSSSQTFQTQSYSKTIGNTNSFTISLNESASFETSFNFLFWNSSINVNVNSSQTWDKTTTTEETVTAPSQSFIVGSNSKGIAQYIIRQGTYKSDGIIRYYLPSDFKITSPKYRGKDGLNHWNTVFLTRTIKEIASKYPDMLAMDYKGNSVLSVNDINNPTIIIFNIPITWNSQGGKLDVNFSENPLENQ